MVLTKYSKPGGTAQCRQNPVLLIVSDPGTGALQGTERAWRVHFNSSVVLNFACVSI